MLIISPRSYVTAAFDLLFPVLLEYLFTRIKKNNEWWDDFVYTYRDDLFSKNYNDSDIRDQVIEGFRPQCYRELLFYFDEQILCKLVLNYIPRYLLKDYGIDKEIFNKIKKIRNKWAHRNYRQEEHYIDEKAQRKWAESSILLIRDIASIDLKNPIVDKKISILLFKMKCDWINDDTRLRSHKELLKWISDNVVIKVTASDSPVEDFMKARIIKSFEELEKYVDKVSPKTASRYVVDYYWNAIRGKTDVYDEIDKHNNVPTFESKVEEFTNYCYKDEY